MRGIAAAGPLPAVMLGNLCFKRSELIGIAFDFFLDLSGVKAVAVPTTFDTFVTLSQASANTTTG